MAKVPLLSPGIKPFDAPPYPLNAVCAAPGCDQPSGDPHHLWRRSFLAGAYDWVVIPEEGVVVGNVVGLCRNHHDQIESGAAWITWTGYQMLWSNLFDAERPLLWQPPVIPLSTDAPPNLGSGVFGGSLAGESEADREAASPPDPGVHELDVEHSPIADLPLDREPMTWMEDQMEPRPAHDPEVCPSCKRPLPRPKIKTPLEAARPRRTWSVTVPMDQRENGAEILDELLEASREGMARKGLVYGEGEKTKFGVLGTSLALWVQHLDTIMGDA